MSHELLLLRHGQVESHRGDVPVTEDGLTFARQVGRSIGTSLSSGVLRIMNGGTRRTRETAAAVAAGAEAEGVKVIDDEAAFALRNPDLYLAGVRVNMVSSAADFAVQVPGLSEEEVLAADFFGQWLTVPERVGWWVAHQSPPGDDAASVAARIERFAASTLDRADQPALTVGVTHSPVLRALALKATGEDPGEPTWLAGIRVVVDGDRTVTFQVLDEAP